MRFLVLIAAAALVACSQPAATTSATMSATDTNMANMPMTTTTSTTSTVDVMGSGVITAIDPISYTVTISHGPIAAINWPAMTMTFTAQDPAILKGLAVGDHVSFQLKSVSEPGTVIAIHKQ